MNTLDLTAEEKQAWWEASVLSDPRNMRLSSALVKTLARALRVEWALGASVTAVMVRHDPVKLAEHRAKYEWTDADWLAEARRVLREGK